MSYSADLTHGFPVPGYLTRFSATSESCCVMYVFLLPGNYISWHQKVPFGLSGRESTNSPTKELMSMNLKNDQ